MHKRILLPGLLDLALVLTFVPAALADTVPEPVDLAFIVDGSGRFSNTDFHIMLNGIPDAITNSQCVPQDATLWLTVVQFSSDATVRFRGPLEPVDLQQWKLHPGRACRQWLHSFVLGR